MTDTDHDDRNCVVGVTWILSAFAFALPISIALAAPLGYLAVLAAILLRTRGPHLWRFRWQSLYWPMIVYATAAVISVFYSVRPMASVAKLPRLILMGLVPVIASMPADSEQKTATKLAAWFIAGCVGKALYHVGVVVARVPTGVNPFDLGNMRDPQMYLTAALVLLATLAAGAQIVPKRCWTLCSLLVVVAGLVLNFKRGAWLAALISFLVVVMVVRKWRWLLLVGVVFAVLWAVPLTRHRIEQSRQELSVRFGGRYVLWTEVAPVMLRRFPQGIGYAASRNSDFLQYAPRVQPGLHHLHNNVLQVALELGWVGLAAWLWWVASSLWHAAATYRCVRFSSPPQAALTLGILGSLVGLLGNGMVEYNFGDSEILMLWYLLTGLSLLIGQSGGQAGGREVAV